MTSVKREEEFNIGSLIRLIKREGIYVLHWVRTDLFMITSEEFLSFSKEDIFEKSLRGRINALCNAKRAIENRIDTLLYNYGLGYYVKKSRWTFPMKIKKLSEINIRAPRVLQNMITSKRNLLEHEYMIPKDHREVEDIIDIAELFLKATERYMKGTIRMINSPPHQQYSKNAEGKIGFLEKLGFRRGKYIVIFDFNDNTINIYEKNLKRELKIDRIDEKDIIELIKTILSSHPSIEDYYSEEEWKINRSIELAEKMISTENQRNTIET